MLEYSLMLKVGYKDFGVRGESVMHVASCLFLSKSN